MDGEDDGAEEEVLRRKEPGADDGSRGRGRRISVGRDVVCVMGRRVVGRGLDHDRRIEERRKRDHRNGATNLASPFEARRF